jgi:hypothetical protein
VRDETSRIEVGGDLAKQFDFDLFEKLCGLPEVITQEDIAWVMGFSVDTCVTRLREFEEDPTITFSEFRRKRQSRFRINLINKQISLALSGNVTMCIWLGRNYLGQTDKEPQQNKQTASEEKLIIDLSGDISRERQT